MRTRAPRNAGDLYRAARKYHVVLREPARASSLHVLSGSSCRLAMASLSNLSKYLGIYRHWKDIVVNADLKWSNGNSEDIVIKRFTRSQNPAELIDWICKVKKEIPSLSAFMDLVAFTGIRFVEAANSYNLVTRLYRKGQLHRYYDSERSLLEHYRFKDTFIRRSKKVFVSFVSEDLVNATRKCTPISENAIQNRIKRARLRLRFGDLREYWATVMTRTLRQPEIDFLQGRVSSTVFMRNYFNPAWITDLKQRTLEVANEILSKIR